MKNTDSFATIPTTVNVPVQTIKDLLDCSFEGGSPWQDRLRRVGVEPYGKSGLHLSDVPFVKGGSVTIICENPRAEGNISVTLDPASLEKGLRIMAEKYPKHFADAISENMDADTGDVFVQCCAFGETVFC